VPDHLKQFEFKPGQPKVGGRAKGTRNKISEAFLRDLHAEWERSGAATLKILAVENPAAFAALAVRVLPQAFDDEMPAMIRIITGVPRQGDADFVDDRARVPQIASVTQLGAPAKEGDDV
jgi:hypothetical protein